MLYRSNGGDRTLTTTEGDPDGPRRRLRPLEPPRRARGARAGGRRHPPCRRVRAAAVSPSRWPWLRSSCWRSWRPTAASAFVVCQPGPGGPRGHPEPRPAARRRHMECMSPPEAARFLAAHGFGTVDWQLESGTTVTPDGGKGSSTTAHQTTPPEHGYVIPGSLLPTTARRSWSPISQPVPPEFRRRLRVPDATTSVDVTAPVRPDFVIATGRSRAFEVAVRLLYAPADPAARARSGRRARRRGPRAGRVPPRLSARGTGSMARTSGWLYTIGLRLAFTIGVAAGAGSRRSVGRTRLHGPIRRP